MRRTSFTDMNCSVAQTLEVIGEWWTPLILRDAFFGVTRFEDFQSRLGIARNVLTQRLDSLVEHDVFEKVAYQDKPVRYDYRLTEKGADLWLVITTLRQWGDKWAAAGGAPIELRHNGCGEVVTIEPACSNCGAIVDPRDLTVVAGPGAIQQN